MRKNKITAKVIHILVIVFVAISMVACGSKKEKEESYRSIQIYMLEGTATIERADIGKMNAFENLYLESGDRIFVDEGSQMRLKLDDDKYVMAEQNTIFTIMAEGTKENSKTSIHLEKGAIINEIQNALNENSSYDISTPNSVMAVRGTVFRVEVVFDSIGEVYVEVSTYDGKVETRLVYPDGTIEEKTVLVEDGKDVMIHMDTEDTEYLSEPKEAKLEDLPIQSLEFLRDVIQRGSNLSNTDLKEIETIIEKQMKEHNNRDENQDGENGEKEPDPKPEITPDPPVEPTPDPEPNPEPTPDPTPDPEPEPNPEPTPDPMPDPEPEPNPDPEPEPNPEPTPDPNPNPTPDPEPTPKTYTITYMYNGVVFGTQIVEEREFATEPLLLPAPQGNWDYDFTTPVTQDITINWK